MNKAKDTNQFSTEDIDFICKSLRFTLSETFAMLPKIKVKRKDRLEWYKEQKLYVEELITKMCALEKE